MASSKRSGQQQELIALRNAVGQQLPSCVDDAIDGLTLSLYNASLLSALSLHPSSRIKDEAWRLLSAAGAQCTSEHLDAIHGLVQALHGAVLRNHSSTDDSSDDHRLSEWNERANGFFDQMLLKTGAGKRVALEKPSAALQHSGREQKGKKSQANTSTGFEASWLRLRCSSLEVVRGGGLPAHEMAASILTLLNDKARTNDHIQSDLFDAFAGDFDAVGDVLSHRTEIQRYADAILADCSQAHELQEKGVAEARPSRNRGYRGRGSRNGRPHQGLGSQVIVRDTRQEALRKEQDRERRRLKRSGFLPENEGSGDDDFIPMQDLGGSQYEERQKAFPGIQMQRDAVIGSVDRTGLPAGATREVGKGYEEIFLPPPVTKPTKKEELIEIASGLAEHSELLRAMRGVKTLNRLQSAVFPVAFKTDENLLVCAPTGAGKTNVALLTIFREIVAVKTRLKRAFKVVYVAPMKALAAEVTEKFGQRLGPLNLRVREFTGDMSLSRAEALETHVLVTTPEKWDVVTRKSGSDLGDAVTLFIVDEVHLLHDGRGAVLESIVARTLRLSETAQKQIRLVGLSATLPNFADVGSFMRVNPKRGLFHFDGSHRPVPLSQTFIGISEGLNSNTMEARRRREAKMHEMAWKKVKDSLQRGHQAMIFVHSRKGTGKAAREMISRATLDECGSIFLGTEKKGSNRVVHTQDAQNDDGSEEESVLPTWAMKEISKSRTGEIRELCARGVGIHNAGLPRPDRKLVEKLFSEGVIRLLCCTATLAWGVNLPARTVVIMGTEVYNAEKGGFEQLGMLDVMQIFGRAGRPQFDTEGEGTIITDHDNLGRYLSLLTSSIPIESQLGASASRLADHLNAEVVSGTVSSIGDGVKWLSYTYLSVRMPQNPLVYGIDWAEVEADFGLHSKRARLIEEAAQALDDARMCRYDLRSGVLSPTDLGRVSSHFYVSHETVELWNDFLGNLSTGPAVSGMDWEKMYSLVLHAVSCATEFEQMRSRQEEAEELDYLTRKACPIPLKSGSETREGKVSILFQAYISRAQIRMSDLSYVVQSATRLLRALFEISLRKGLPSFSLAALELSRSSESRIWSFQHPLWQFTYLARKDKSLLVNPEVIAAIEADSAHSDLAALRSMSREDLSVLIRAPKVAQTVEKAVKSIPTLEIESATVAPLSRSTLEVKIRLCANFQWSDVLHGHLESWWLWIEDKEEDKIYHNQKIMLTSRHVQILNDTYLGKSGEERKQTLDLQFKVAVFDPPSSQYWVRVESDRWHTGGGSTAVLTVASMKLPTEEPFKSSSCLECQRRVEYLLSAEEASIFTARFSEFNSLQAQTFKAARQSNENLLISAPSGSGKLVVAQLATLQAFESRKEGVVVIIVPSAGAAVATADTWEHLVSTTGRKLRVAYSKDGLMERAQLTEKAVLVTTAEVWNYFLFKFSDERDVCDLVSLIIIIDIHRMSHRPHSDIEVTISRLRHLNRLLQSSKTRTAREVPRIVALADVLPNALQIGRWLGVSKKAGLFCFGQESRQVPRESHVIAVAGDRYSTRMHSMNQPVYATIQRYSDKRPVLIFVSSRKQALLTAQDLLRLASLDGKSDMFLTEFDNAKSGVSQFPRPVEDVAVRRTIPKGIGLIHSSLTTSDFRTVEGLFRRGVIQILVATYDMAPRLTCSAHSVIVKGTERFDSNHRRFEDVPVEDVQSMIGLAGRAVTDSSCYAVVFVHEPKQTLFKKLIHEPLPLESPLLRSGLAQIVLQMLVNKRVHGVKDVSNWLEETFYHQRLFSNPGYYGLKKKGGLQKKAAKQGTDQEVAEERRRIQFSEDLAKGTILSLEQMGCATTTQAKRGQGEPHVAATTLGKICIEKSLSIVSGKVLRDSMHNCTSTEEVMNLLNSCQEVRETSKQFEEETDCSVLLGRICDDCVATKRYPNADVAAKRLELTGWKNSFQKRSKMMCYSLMVDGTRDIREVKVSRNALYVNFSQLLSAGVCIALESGTINNVKEIVRTVTYVNRGTLPGSDFWRLVGFEESKACEKGRREGWTSLEEVIQNEKEFAMFLARNCEEAERGAISRWVANCPRFSNVTTSTSESENTVEVNLQVHSKSAVGDGRGTMLLGRSKKSRFLAVVWDEVSEKPVGMQSFVRPDKGVLKNVSIEVEAHVTPSRVWIASLDWIGVEAEVGVGQS